MLENRCSHVYMHTWFSAYIVALTNLCMYVEICLCMLLSHPGIDMLLSHPGKIIDFSAIQGSSHGGGKAGVDGQCAGWLK